ncbi:hypothetical protein MHYP_G00297710 [Metynnis hypsauchen]
MPFSFSLLGGQLRPVVLCATGISAAAVTSYFVFSRWRRILDRQWRSVDAPTETDAFDGMDDHRALFPGICVPVPEPSSREVDRTDKLFASTYKKWSSDGRKLVEVTLQHKAVYNGLQSEHWWVLTNEFYHVRSLQLPPQYFARARAVAFIKLIGTYIREAKVYLQTESSESSVQDVLLNTQVSVTFKGVSIDKEGRFRCHDSSDTQTLETPFVFPSTPRGPPPGF